MAKSIISFLLFIVVFGCANPKRNYNRTPLDLENGTVAKILRFAEAETSDKNVIVFMSWYEKDTIKIFEGEKIVFNTVVETNPVTGLSTFKGISNTQPITIRILSDKPFEIKLKSHDLENYKFIYIERDAWKRDKYSIEHTNQWRKFM